jgi:hypothetical protein
MGSPTIGDRYRPTSRRTNMTNAFPKILTVAAAAAFLAIAPVSAQTSGSGTSGAGGGAADVMPAQDLDQRVNPDTRAMMGKSWRAMTLPEAFAETVNITVGAVVPATAVLQPVPREIFSVVPETQGYEYFVLADGRIVLVHPADNTIAMILD